VWLVTERDALWRRRMGGLWRERGGVEGGAMEVAEERGREKRLGRRLRVWRWRRVVEEGGVMEVVEVGEDVMVRNVVWFVRIHPLVCAWRRWTPLWMMS
jgi:hypothetical protein